MSKVKTIVNISAWTAVLGGVIYMAVGHESAIFIANPLACLGTGMIGLGWCMEARRKLASVVEGTKASRHQGNKGLESSLNPLLP